MILFENFSQAMANLFYAKLRSFLAVLGIMVGTASVVALVTSGQLATAQALAQFKHLGTDLLAVSVFSANHRASSNASNRLSADDWMSIEKELPNITQVAPYTAVYETVSYNGHNLRATIVAADNYLKEMIKIKIAAGDFPTFLHRYEKVCFVGADIAKKMRQYHVGPLIGQQLFLGKQVYTVVGVAKKWQESSFFNNDVNKSVFIPLRGVSAINQQASVNSVIFKLKANINIDKEIEGLRNFIKQKAPSLSMFPRSAKQIIESMESQGQVFTLLLGLIGGISLLVGGIGVMNVMLVSVMERKKEIGIRLAIGAKKRDIRLLFLMESVVLSLFGGFLGVVLGIIATFFISYFTHWPFMIFLTPPLIGFLVSAITGIFFGFYPAFRAANLRPIETLRMD